MMERETKHQLPMETARLGDKLYNMDKLKEIAERLPTETAPLTEFTSAVAAGNYYWTDKNNEKLGPFQILQDWQEAQKNPAWSEHVQNIQQADLQDPLWVAPDGFVMNGMHRLTRHFIEASRVVPYKKFTELPQEAIISEA